MLITIVIIGLLSSLLFGIFVTRYIGHQMRVSTREVVNVRYDLLETRRKKINL
ncbi:hypothetical protein SDC9_120274 [bioreactor metagenome]|uniref:Uncharacterized protein n=1 Tax=bioreactor metagenome TaxID=1076179 RepID=A0A645C9P3_9ZZZZ